MSFKQVNHIIAFFSFHVSRSYKILSFSHKLLCCSNDIKTLKEEKKEDKKEEGNTHTQKYPTANDRSPPESQFSYYKSMGWV